MIHQHSSLLGRGTIAACALVGFALPGRTSSGVAPCAVAAIASTGSAPLARASTRPVQAEELYRVACGWGSASDWSAHEVQQALREDGRALVGLYLRLDELGAREGVGRARLDATEMVFAAFAGVGSELRRSALGDELARDGSLERRLAAWLLEGRVADDPALLFELGAGTDGPELRATRVQRTFASAFASILRNDPLSRQVVQLARTAPAELAPAIVRGVLERGGPRAIELLTELHDATGDLQVAVLAAVPRLDVAVLAHGSAPLAVRLREDALLPDAERQRLALAGLGELRHLGSLPLLLDTWQSAADRRLAVTARRAAARIVGQDLGEDLERWRSWLEEQSAWESEELPALLEDLRMDADPAAVRLALDLAARRPAHHARLLGPVARHLTSREPSLVVAAARTLHLLGAPEAAIALADALRTAPAPLRRALLDALRGLCEQDLPAHPDIWIQYLRGGATV